jgi:hypothetical protein
MVSRAETVGITAEPHDNFSRKETNFLKRELHKGRMRIVLAEYLCGISDFNLGIYKKETL